MSGAILHNINSLTYINMGINQNILQKKFIIVLLTSQRLTSQLRRRRYGP